MNEEMSTVRYWNEIYAGISHAQPGGHEADRFAEVMKHLSPAYESILEVAAGYAALAKRIVAAFPKKTVVALDFSPEAAKRSGFKPYHVGDASKMPFVDKEFDTVICCQGMGYMEDPRAFLRECARVSSRLILTVSKGKPAAGTRWEFDEQSLTSMLAEYGAVQRIYATKPALLFAVVVF